LGINITLSELHKTHPEYHVRIYDDEDLSATMGRLPEYEDTFNSLATIVEKTDMWRYAVLFLDGGVYLDYDVDVIKEVDRWGEFLSEPYGALVGAEKVLQTEEERMTQGFTHRIQWCQWTLVSRPNHPLFKRTLDSILQYILHEQRRPSRSVRDPIMDVLMRTGPGRFTQAVNAYLSEQGTSSDNVVQRYVTVGDVGFLPTHAFGYRDNPGNVVDWRQVCVLHNFAGTWK
jgi:mannosyltransferase OCH1-like enzyme